MLQPAHVGHLALLRSLIREGAAEGSFDRELAAESDEAADFLGISPGTLVVWRCMKRYPVPYLKVGRKVLYDVDDLVAFLESRKVGSVVHAT